MQVKFTLISLNLEDLLKEELPPTQFEPEFKRWKYWSRMVAGWLFRQVEDDIQSAIYEQPDHPVEAFKLYKEILKQVQGNGRNLYAIPAIIKYEKLRRNEFTSAANFITEFEKQFNALRRMKVFISPNSALVKVMHQIEGEVEKVRYIKEEIGQLTPDEITDGLHMYLKALVASAENSSFL